MGRIFGESTKRNVKLLDGAWKMRVDAENAGLDERWFDAELCDGELTFVPSVWATKKELFCYEGAVWFEKSFYFEGGCLFLSFGAVMTEADVWLDGVYLGNHYGGFCQFDFTVNEVSAGTHRLTVRANNAFDAYSIPQTYVDWYHHGGIIRSVCAQALKGISVLSNKFDYTLSADFSVADCRFTVELLNTSKSKDNTTLILAIGDKKVYEGRVDIEGNEKKTVVIDGVKLENIKLWDIGKGNLYSISATTDTDELFDRVGFRHIEVKDKAIYLNGKKIEIMGVNRHEEHPELGFAFPQSLMTRDLDLIEELGCNFIRGAHYPNSRDFLDMLDERGIMFWSEIPIWGCGFSEQTLADEKVVERGLDMHREMLKYYYNHPSIVMWGMHNEILSNTRAGYEMSRIYYNYLKENGGNRLVVYASRFPTADICFEFTDAICINQYYGWYVGEYASWADEIKKLTDRQKELGFEDKPIIMSEFGAAALYGCHDEENFLWTEEYQAKLISHCLELFHEHPAIVGSIIWHFADARTSKEPGISRARRFNNKGLLNEYRKPKLSYFATQKCYKRFKEENK